jgi:RNA polymerase sigma factor (sigma-70 family)
LRENVLPVAAEAWEEADMADGRPVDELVEAAASGDALAWDEIVERYAPLVVAVCRQFRLSEADLKDVSQTVWLRLVEHLHLVREPRALPGWLVTTSRRECLRVMDHSRRQTPIGGFPVEGITGEDEDISIPMLQAERRSALREAFAALSATQQELMLLLLAEPPLTYDEISRRLGIPHGSIGPTRARAIARLRAAAPLAALFDEATVEPDTRKRSGSQRSR